MSYYSKDKEKGQEEENRPAHDGRGCAWTGCTRVGVISTHTKGGPFYCRTHANEVMPMDYTEPRYRNPIANILADQGKEIPFDLGKDERN